MSHFVVVVIGDNVEEQLAPYHEYECTGEPSFIEDLDITDEVRKAFSKSDVSDVREFLSEEYLYPIYSEDAKIPPPEEGAKYGFAVLDKDDNLVRVVRRTNPNAKWDWWVVGGRWQGYFPLKEGASGELGEDTSFPRRQELPVGRADIVKAQNVDFEKALSEAEDRARKEFAEWKDCFTRFGKPEKGWKSFLEEKKAWKKRVEKESQGIPPTLEETKEWMRHAREAYSAQPAIREYSKTAPWGCPVDIFGFDEEEYVKTCVNATLVPYAIVRDGKWHARGDMGWWGMSSNEKDEQEWCAFVQDVYAQLAPDTLLTAVDCHI